MTCFSSCFALAPFFALINNWVEIRLDAKKLLCDSRRTDSERASSIGVWFQIISTLVNIGVICNVSEKVSDIFFIVIIFMIEENINFKAFLLAFTSNFLPKLVYQLTEESDLNGYIEFSLGMNSRKCLYLYF